MEMSVDKVNIIELEHARELPAWYTLKVLDRHGWRTLTEHEICLLNEIFVMIRDEDEDDLFDGRAEYLELGKTLGLLPYSHSD